jgi:hypothetical protein
MALFERRVLVLLIDSPGRIKDKERAPSREYLRMFPFSLPADFFLSSLFLAKPVSALLSAKEFKELAVRPKDFLLF